MLFENLKLILYLSYDLLKIDSPKLKLYIYLFKSFYQLKKEKN